MWVWWMIIVVCSVIGYMADEERKRNIKKERIENAGLAKYFFLISVILIFFAGLRSTTGDGVQSIGDTRVYTANFRRLVKDNIIEYFKTVDFETDWGFYGLMSLVRQIFGVKEQGLFFFCSLVTIGCIMYRYYKLNLGYTWLLIFFYITLGSYVSSMNGGRQWLVSAIMFMALPWLEKRKFKRYTLLVVVLSTIHSSVFVFLILYFVVVQQAWGKITKYMIAFVIILLITYPVTGPIISRFLSDSDSTYSVYSSSIISGSGGTNVIRIITYIIPVLFAFIYREKMKCEPYYNIVINMAVLDMLFMMMAIQNWIYARFCIYFEPYLLIVYIWDLKYCFDLKSKRIVNLAFVLYGVVWFWYQMYIAWSGQIYTSKVLGIG